MPNPSQFYSSDGTFLAQLFALAVLRRLSVQEQASVIHVLQAVR